MLFPSSAGQQGISSSQVRGITRRGWDVSPAILPKQGVHGGTAPAHGGNHGISSHTDSCSRAAARARGERGCGRLQQGVFIMRVARTSQSVWCRLLAAQDAGDGLEGCIGRESSGLLDIISPSRPRPCSIPSLSHPVQFSPLRSAAWPALFAGGVGAGRGQQLRVTCRLLSAIRVKAYRAAVWGMRCLGELCTHC
jgi:hypothetical protein